MERLVRRDKKVILKNIDTGWKALPGGGRMRLQIKNVEWAVDVTPDTKLSGFTLAGRLLPNNKVSHGGE